MAVAAKTFPTAQQERTRAFYEMHAARYAAFSRDADLGPLARQLIGRVPAHARVLDLGCGAGRDAQHIIDNGYSVVGVDYATALLRYAAQVSTADLIQADMRALPFAPSSFSAVWAVASLLHVRKTEIVEVLADVATVVKPSGLLFASMKKGTGEHVADDGRFFSFYQDDEWLHVLRQAGWQLVQLDGDVEHRGQQHIEWLLTVAAKR